MHIFTPKPSYKKLDDPALVLASIGGDKEAFCEIVARYQNLLCSIAYASVGDFKHSEDIAQDVFVEAWQKLDSLRDSNKLKSWLCSILRFKLSHHYRKEQKLPTHQAQEIDEQTQFNGSEVYLEDQAINEQQQTLLWDTLSTIDVNYREPLVLFYREQQSVENVANQLEINIDTAKQRLSRGRKLLQKAMSKLMEEALEKSKPGAVFTAAVFVSLEEITKHAAAAALTASSIKTSSLFKTATITTAFASISGLISAFFGFKASLYQTRTENERRLSIKITLLFVGTAALFVAAMYALQYAAISYQSNEKLFALSSQIIVLVFIASYLGFITMALKKAAELRAQERIFHPEAYSREVDKPSSAKREYKSSATFMGFPLIHFNFAAPEKHAAAPIAWIAGGNKAYGLFFAWGGLAIAPVSIGIVSVGVISVGAVGFGLFSVGTVALGLIGFGASAIAYKAYSSLSSLGWESAVSGGFSIAKEAAVGNIAFAANVNNEAAHAISDLTIFTNNFQWILIVMSIFVILPTYAYYKQVRKRMK